MDLIAIGDNVVDCYIDQGVFYPGGNCVNVAVSAKRNGARIVEYIGVLATDKKSEAIQEALTKEGITWDKSRIAYGISGQPGVNLVDGDRIFVGGPRNTVQHILKLKLTTSELAYLESYDICHVSVYSNLEEELASIAEHVAISYDFSERIEVDFLQQVCPHVTYAFFSGADYSEEEIIAAAEQMMTFGTKLICVTRGSKDVLIYQDHKLYTFKVPKASVLDTMGAGDSFIGAFLTAYEETKKLENAVTFGIASSQKTCQHYGGFGYPHPLINE